MWLLLLFLVGASLSGMIFFFGRSTIGGWYGNVRAAAVGSGGGIVSALVGTWANFQLVYWEPAVAFVYNPLGHLNAFHLGAFLTVCGLVLMGLIGFYNMSQTWNTSKPTFVR